MYIVIAGAGRLGVMLAKRLKQDDHQVCLIEKREDICRILARETNDYLIIHGDATYMHILEDAKIDRAQVCVSATSSDEDNIIICNIAKEMFGVKRTVARVNDPKHIDFYKYMDVDNPVDSTAIIAQVVEEEASFNDVMSLLSMKKGRLSVVRVDIPQDSPVVDKRVGQIQLPSNCVLISIIRGPEIIIPSGMTEIKSGDEVIAAALIDQEKDLVRALIGKL
ncbi:MAG: NAD-binding protein [Candidatus Omnitrophica bacterium]|nr:NAD-binding protein [Candidatus Omnitrophota bacterium]MDD5081293.1 NAD-binding protein [Candidatus Omnitrophota bacterium]MDD5441463.1 NAD-binding protein [Candidatus Omnitrophota bacterium]